MELVPFDLRVEGIVLQSSSIFDDLVIYRYIWK